MKQHEPVPDEQESRAAVALTIAWMLTCMSTAVGMLVFITLMLLSAAYPVPLGRMHPFEKIAAVLLFLALVTGTLCLAFTALAFRARVIAPPRAIAIAAVVIGLSPIVAIIFEMLMNG
jgi:hypothetical protein